MGRDRRLMDQSEIRAAIQSQIGKHPYVTASDIDAYINFGLKEMSKLVQGFDEYFTFQTFAGRREYNLPSNLIHLKAPVTIDKITLTPISLDEAQKLYGNLEGALLTPPSSVPGPPSRYYTRRTATTLATVTGSSMAPSGDNIMGSAVAGKYVIGFYPTPTVAGTASFFGTFVPVDLATDADIPAFQELWHGMLVHYGLWWTYLKMREPEMADYHYKHFKEDRELMNHMYHNKPEYVESSYEA